LTQNPSSKKPAPRPATNAIKANIDGGARGNPGPPQYGVIVRDATGEIIAELSDYLGIQTNNYANIPGCWQRLILPCGKNIYRSKC